MVKDIPKEEVEGYVEKYKEKITFESDVDDVLPNKVDDSINVEISERTDNRVDGYIGDEEELKTVETENENDEPKAPFKCIFCLELDTKTLSFW